MIFFLKATVVMSQLVYWLVLRDETREDAVWDACLLLPDKGA